MPDPCVRVDLRTSERKFRALAWFHGYLEARSIFRWIYTLLSPVWSLSHPKLPLPVFAFIPSFRHAGSELAARGMQPLPFSSDCFVPQVKIFTKCSHHRTASVRPVPTGNPARLQKSAISRGNHFYDVQSGTAAGGRLDDSSVR